jgi:hypothetical protein
MKTLPGTIGTFRTQGVNPMRDPASEQQPTVAPSIDSTQTLEREASEKEKERGDSTRVTTLHLDRTPED